MRISVNGEAREVEGTTLADLLEELGYRGVVVATAVNGDFAPVNRRVSLMLTEGDQVEVLAPMQGG